MGFNTRKHLGFGGGFNSAKGFGVPGIAPFSPLNVTGLQLYLPKNVATAASWLDQSPNAFDFVQAVGIQQPTIAANSVDFDGVDDIQVAAGSQLLNDSSGIMFFSGYYDGVNVCLLFTSANSASNAFAFELQVNATGNLILIVTESGSTNIITTTESVATGYFYGYLKSTGTSYVCSLNGSTCTIASGTNNGDWLADVTTRDNLALGARYRASIIYRTASVNKLLYSNADLSAAEITEVETFMSLPSNY